MNQSVSKSAHCRRHVRLAAALAALCLIAGAGCADGDSDAADADETRSTASAQVVLCLVAAAGCADGDSDADADETKPTASAQDLLGPDDVAVGDPIKIGMVSDGQTAAFDNTDELRAGEATAAYFNQHEGGVAGRPVEVVTCETEADPAKAADCANRFIAEGVVAVTLSQSGFTESIWEPLHASGIPTFFSQASGEKLESDPDSTFMVLNPQAAFFGLPIAVAEADDADKITFVVIDVPQAVEIVESSGDEVMGKAGLDYSVVRVPIGTADMVPQMQQVVAEGADVVQILGNDAFCIAAFEGLAAVGFEGSITAVNQCITDATREAMPTGLEGINILSSLAIGADDDETIQLYQAVMAEYGQDVEDVNNFTSVGGYAAVAGLLTALHDLEGEVTASTAAAAIKEMPDSLYPAGGGVMYQCGGSAVPTSPAVCTNQWLRAVLDADGRPSTYTVEDSSGLFG
jgi:branched-chain amino acid transport system substrate-binding protein